MKSFNIYEKKINEITLSAMWSALGGPLLPCSPIRELKGEINISTGLSQLCLVKSTFLKHIALYIADGL